MPDQGLQLTPSTVDEPPKGACKSTLSPTIALLDATDGGSPESSLVEAIDGLARSSLGDPTFSLRAELERPWTRAWVAETQEDGKLERVAGFALAWHIADELHILDVAAVPALRRRGIGSALMARALDYAKEHRVRIVLLELRRSNHAALRLYRSVGFTVLGVRARYYADNDEDAVEMIVALDSVTGAVVPGRDESDLVL